MITERTLKKWRRQSLIERQILKHNAAPVDDIQGHSPDVKLRLEFQERIIKLTQDLLDWHLMRK